MESQLLLSSQIQVLDDKPAPVLVRPFAAVADAIVDPAGGDGGVVVAIKPAAVGATAGAGGRLVRPVRAVAVVVIYPERQVRAGNLWDAIKLRCCHSGSVGG